MVKPIDIFQQQFIILKNEILNTIFLEVVSGNYMKAKVKYSLIQHKIF
jgi:hypothetical protein